MFTRCPECHTAFRVTVAQLTARDGLVRCGRCSAVFRADLRLFATAGGAESSADEAAAATTEAAAQYAAAASGGADRFDQADIPVITDLSLFLPPRRRLLHPALWLLGILVGAGMLIGQFAYFYRNELARVPELKPALERLCRLLDCQLASPATYATPELVETTIAPHPRYANALRIRATLVNRGDTPAPLPRVEVSLTASDGELLARRTFTPQQYLSNTLAAQPMLPNIAVNAVLDLTNPDNKASGYEIKLFPPE
jgi:predicted Zn finger-like uncharacterized protein